MIQAGTAVDEIFMAEMLGIDLRRMAAAKKISMKVPIADLSDGRAEVEDEDILPARRP